MITVCDENILVEKREEVDVGGSEGGGGTASGMIVAFPVL